VTLSVFAQNYPQLMNQARALEFSQAELLQLRSAFELAQRSSRDLYRAEGCPLLNHLVRTASITLAQTRDIQLGVVALLHATYVLQDFDNSTHSRNMHKRRQEVRAEFGDVTEALLWDYETMPWHTVQHIDDHMRSFARKNASDKKILYLHVVNELEDHMDNAMEYTSLKRKARRDKYFEKCIELANMLGHPTLALEIQKQLDNTIQVEDFLRWDNPQGYQLRQRQWQRSWLEGVRALLQRLKHKLRAGLR
jgi:(p)ppGpp synthase/HD superfamily hydrolase